MVDKEFLENFGKECWYIFYMNYYGFSSGSKEKFVGETIIEEAPLYRYYLNRVKEQGKKEECIDFEDKIDNFVNRFKNRLKNKNLKELIRKKSDFQIKELDYMPYLISLQFWEYRFLLARDNDYKKILFLGVFHRRDGYIQALNIYKELLDRGFNKDIIKPIPPSKYSKLKRMIAKRDRRSIQYGRF